jgi:hypothetical protein
MLPWFLLFPFLRAQHGFAPFPLPFAPGMADMREWRIETDPPAFATPNPIPANGRIVVSLHRVLVETGIAMTLATTPWDPRSWGNKRCQEPLFCFFGRPRGRNVVFKPRRRAVRSLHDSLPNLKMVIRAFARFKTW